MQCPFAEEEILAGGFGIDEECLHQGCGLLLTANNPFASSFLFALFRQYFGLKGRRDKETSFAPGQLNFWFEGWDFAFQLGS